ncbi:MAG: DUF3997 domain-containing protein [Verrucomicrobiota bacterium]
MFPSAFRAVFCAIVLLIVSRFHDKRRIMICLRCGIPRKVQRNEICCGDTLVELVEAKWIEDEKDPGYPLTGDYFLVQTSLHDVEIRPRENGNDAPIIRKKVVQIAWDTRLILAKRIGFTGGLPNDNTFEFWILDTKERISIGPLDKRQFAAKQKELGLTGDASPFLIPVERLPKLPLHANVVGKN